MLEFLFKVVVGSILDAKAKKDPKFAKTCENLADIVHKQRQKYVASGHSLTEEQLRAEKNYNKFKNKINTQKQMRNKR